MLDAAVEPVPEAAKSTLLKASTMIYLFRALTETNSLSGKRDVELHLIKLVNDVSGTDGGFVVLAEPGRPLNDTFRNAIFRASTASSSVSPPKALFTEPGMGEPPPVPYMCATGSRA